MNITTQQLASFIEIINEAQSKASMVMNTIVEFKVVAEGLGTISSTDMLEISKSMYKEFIKLCAAANGFKYEDIIGPSRIAEIVFVRHAICYIAKENFKMLTLKELGMGGRDHSTVIHSNTTALDLIATEHEVFMPIYEKCLAEYPKCKID